MAVLDFGLVFKGIDYFFHFCRDCRNSFPPWKFMLKMNFWICFGILHLYALIINLVLQLVLQIWNHSVVSSRKENRQKICWIIFDLLAVISKALSVEDHNYYVKRFLRSHNDHFHRPWIFTKSMNFVRQSKVAIIIHIGSKQWSKLKGFVDEFSFTLPTGCVIILVLYECSYVKI